MKEIDNHMTEQARRLCPTCEGEKAVRDCVTCPKCGGSGYYPDSDDKCDYCDGLGDVLLEPVLCPDCEGLGHYEIG